MKAAFFVVVAFFLAVDAHGDHGGDEGGSYSASGPVKIGTDANFVELVKATEISIVEFYAPWCGYCKKLTPQYIAAAEQLAASEYASRAALIAVDATVHEKLAAEYEIQGFPTLIIFKNGKKLKDYEASRDAKGLIATIEGLLLPAVSSIKNQEQLEKARASAEVLVIGHFTVPDNEVARKAFHDAAEAVRNAGFGQVRSVEVEDAAVASKENLLATPIVRVERRMSADEGTVTHDFDFFSDAGFDAARIEAFVKLQAFPALAEISPKNYPLYDQRDLPFLWAFLPGHGTPQQEGQTQEAPSEEVAQANKASKAALLQAGAATAGKLSVVWLSGVDYKEHAEQLGVNTQQLPAYVIMYMKKNKRFVYEGAQDALSSWAQLVLDGKVDATVKSEPVPETNDEPVKVVVAKNINELVFDNDADVFIEFYAPWCGHCKKLTPTWNKLAADFKKAGSNVVFAKMDATANDAPEGVEGFPTLYFKKGSNKARALDAEFLYKGDRKRASLISFINEHASSPVPAELLTEAAPEKAAEKAADEKPADADAAGKDGELPPLPVVDYAKIEQSLDQITDAEARAELEKLIKQHKDIMAALNDIQNHPEESA